MSGVIGWQNRLISSGLNTGSQVANLPVSNIFSDQGSEIWRTASGAVSNATGAWFNFDAGSAVSWQAFGIFRTNLTAAATMTVKLGTSLNGTQVLNQTVSGLHPGTQQLVLVLPSALSARYLRIEVNDAANPDGHIDVGLCYAGPVFRPEFNFSFDAAFGRSHRTDETITAGGQSFPRPYWQARAWNIAWQALRTDEVWQTVYDLDRYGRFGGNVLFVPDTSGAYVQQESIFGRLSDTSDVGYSGAFNDIRNWRARIVERL